MRRDIEAIELGALQHGIENGGALPAGFGAKEQEVLAGNSDAAQGALGELLSIASVPSPA